MRNMIPAAALLLGATIMAAPAAAEQQAEPAPACKATLAQMAEAKKTAIAFIESTANPEARLALLDPGYKQHSPNFAKAAREAGKSDYEYVKSVLADYPRFVARQGGAGTGGRDGAAGPQPPPRKLELAMVECDLVTIMLKIYRQDPSAAPGTFYESFAFDTYRVRNGKIVEHWDQQLMAVPGSRGG